MIGNQAAGGLSGIRAVVFDLAGTTVDFGSCAPAGAFVELFDRRGISVTDAQAREPMGLHKRDHIVAILEMPEVARQWTALFDAPPGDEEIDALYSEFIPLQVQILPKFSEVIPGVLETVSALRDRGCGIAVTTGYNREMMTVVVNAARAQGLIPDAAICAQDVPRGRPAPWMNWRALEALDVFPASCAVVVGDTIPDIEAGRHCGAWTVGVAVTGNMMGLSQAEFDALGDAERAQRRERAFESLRLAGAHEVIDSVADLPNVVERFGRRLNAGDRP